MKSLLSILLVAGVALFALADEPEKDDKAKGPVRLKRSSNKKDESKDAAKKTVDDKAPEVEAHNIPVPEAAKKKSELDEKLLGELGQNLENANEEESDPLMRAQRRMREVEEALARTEAGEKTVTIQDQIVKDLEEMLKPPSGDPKKASKAKKSSKKNSKKMQALQKQMQLANKGNQPKDSKDGNPQGKAGAARKSDEQRGRAQENKDAWGHLADSDKQEMSQYAKENFLGKYRELLEKYYSTIATKSRGKD